MATNFRTFLNSLTRRNGNQATGIELEQPAVVIPEDRATLRERDGAAGFKESHLVEAGEDLLKQGKFDEAERAFKVAMEMYPDNPNGYAGYAKAAQHREEWDEAIARWDALLGIFPESATGWTGLADVLVKLRRYEEAERIYAVMKQRFPDHIAGYEGFARMADLLRQWETAAERWDEATGKFPSHVKMARAKLNSLLSRAEFEAAERYLAVCKSQFNQGYFIAESLRLQRIKHDQEALARVVEEALTIQDVTVKFSEMIKSLYRDFYFDHALRLLQHAFKLHRTQQGDAREALKLEACECEILILKKEYLLAINKMRQLEQKMEHEPDLRRDLNAIWSELDIWRQAHIGRLKRADKLWRNSTRSMVYTMSSGISDWRLLSGHAVNIRRGDVLLIGKIRNEMFGIEDFCDYYRHIGVDRFLFIDNGSNDGTVEYLLSRPDVCLFQTTDSMRNARAGAAWINRVIHQYAAKYQNWCVVVDGDEYLITLEIETHGLRPLLKYMDKYGHAGLFAFMLDMYPERYASMKNKGGSFREMYTYFDNNYRMWGYVESPFTFVTGGFRTRFANTVYLPKTPLIKASDSLVFTDANHFTNPVKMSDVTGVLLHYKFAGDIEQEISTEIQRKEYSQGAYKYRQYQNYFSNLPINHSFLNEWSVEYQSSKQLNELGLIKTSPDYKKFIRKNKTK